MFESLENNPGCLLAMYAERIFLVLAREQFAVEGTSLGRLNGRLDHWFTELFCRIDDLFVCLDHGYYGNRPVFWNYKPPYRSSRFSR